jgi:hypothetical protein
MARFFPPREDIGKAGKDRKAGQLMNSAQARTTSKLTGLTVLTILT